MYVSIYPKIVHTMLFDGLFEICFVVVVSLKNVRIALLELPADHFAYRMEPMRPKYMLQTTISKNIRLTRLFPHSRCKSSLNTRFYSLGGIRI